MLAAAMLSPGIAAAYVGPGAGISLLGALWGLIVGVVLAFGIILIWPIRMMLKKKRAREALKNAETSGETAQTEPAGDPEEQHS